MEKIILASTSRWRKEILKKTGIQFAVKESRYHEDMSLKLSPRAMTRKFAFGKAAAVAAHNPGAIVIGADTVLVRDKKILGKPKNDAEARKMLRAWSGKSGEAITSVALIRGKKQRIKTFSTKVTFKRLHEDEINAYVKTKEPLTGAGAFTIMSRGASLVRRIEGDFYTIVGLPLSELTDMLREF